MFGAVGPEILHEQDPGQVQLELDYSQVGDPTVLSSGDDHFSASIVCNEASYSLKQLSDQV